MQKTERTLLKRTTMSVRIQDNPRQLRGLMRFSSETASAKLHPLTTSINYKKIQILYRNQLENEEEEESELRSKKEMEHYEVRIARQKDKQLEYRLEIPILRGLKATKNAKASELFFTFSYGGSEGVLSLQDGLFQVKREVVRGSKGEPLREKLQRQMARLDKRRRDDSAGLLRE